MKANEFRIGNFVECLGECRQILGVSNRLRPDCGYFEFNELPPLKGIHIKPIPLTEEWLIKFGFDTWKDCFNNVYHVLNGFEMENINTYCGVGNSQEIKYVHQLQNLYFALTGEELTIKEVIQ